MEQTTYLLYLRSELDHDLSSIGESIKIAPYLWVVRSRGAAADVLGACAKFADKELPVVVAELSGDRAFSASGMRGDLDAKIRQLVRFK